MTPKEKRQILTLAVSLQTQATQIIDLMSSKFNKESLIYDLLEMTCDALTVRTHELQGDLKIHEITDARFIFAQIAIEHGYTTDEIANMLKKNRTSVYYMLDRYKTFVKTDPAFELKAKRVREYINDNW